MSPRRGMTPAASPVFSNVARAPAVPPAANAFGSQVSRRMTECRHHLHVTSFLVQQSRPLRWFATCHSEESRRLVPQPTIFNRRAGCRNKERVATSCKMTHTRTATSRLKCYRRRSRCTIKSRGSQLVFQLQQFTVRSFRRTLWCTAVENGLIHRAPPTGRFSAARSDDNQRVAHDVAWGQRLVKRRRRQKAAG